MNPIRLLRGLLAVTALSVPFSALAQQAGEIVPGSYIVQLRPGADVDATLVRHGVAARQKFRHAARGFAAELSPVVLAELRADAAVESIVPNRVVVALGKPGSGGGGGSQVVPVGVAKIGAAPGAAGYDGTGVGVAIADTGIDYAQTDLAPAAAQFSAFGGSAQDDEGHGTHVSGTVAALNNNLGVVGVAPAAKLYGVKVLNAQGSGSDSDIIAGLDWIAANANTVSPKIRVVNMSLGRPGSVSDNPALHAAVQALDNLGITVVVAAGNDASLEVKDQIPAAYPEVVAVASVAALAGTSATTLAPIAADTASYFTSDGALDANGTGVTISAPGEEQENIIKGNRLTGVGVLSLKLGGGTTRMSGTSMASPHVAGVVALLYQKFGVDALDSTAVKSKLMAGATGVGALPKDGRTTSYTFDGEREGVLSATGALAH